MKLYIMKREALETLKNNLPVVYGKYYTEKTNDWLWDICGGDPFVEYKDVPEFHLTSLDADYKPGEIDLNNCKIMFERLQFLSESQASDERLWAGLTHSTFYEYMRRRWGYGYGTKPKSAEKEASAIQTRFFFKGSGRNGFYRNTLAKCWWVGHNTYDPNNKQNPFERLDIIGWNDLNSKVTEFFFNFTFSSNQRVLSAIIEALRQFNDAGRPLAVREHIRPALSYLNAVGGSVVIDCLDDEQITQIFTDAIDAIMQGDTPSLHLETNTTADAEDIDYSNDEALAEIRDDDAAEVVLGSKVILQDADKETKRVKYDLLRDSKLPANLEPLTGHKVGDTVELSGKEWKIVDVILG